MADSVGTTKTTPSTGDQTKAETPNQQAPGAKGQGSSKKKDKKNKKDGGKSPRPENEKVQGGKSPRPENEKVQGQAQAQAQAQGNDPAKPQKSKAELKAERRALQEKQRALKNAKKDGTSPAGGGGKEGGGAAVVAPASKKEPKRVPDHIKADDEQTQKRVQKKLEKQHIPQRTTTKRKVRLFSHLDQYERGYSMTKSLKFSGSGIHYVHPAIVTLGIQYAEGVICGSNARCLALMAAFKQVITDYSTPPQKELSRDLESKLKPYISFITQCRRISVSMGNAIKYLKWHISHIPSETSEKEAKAQLCDCIERFVNEKIHLAGKGISKYVKDEKKITDGDVIVVFGCSSLVRRVICDAHQENIRFRVIVVDSRPRLEGKEMLRRLVRAGIKCSYVLINAASYAMQEATKVYLGAHALLANGCVMSRVGSSLIAMIAKSYNVPVLVCCETYKFCERGQTDSFVFNELGDPDDVVAIGNKTPYLSSWRDESSLTLLNLVYDVMPQEFVSLVITELGLIPCTSVPVVLRMQQIETNET